MEDVSRVEGLEVEVVVVVVAVALVVVLSRRLVALCDALYR